MESFLSNYRNVYLGLGANLGDRSAIISRAIEEITKFPDTVVVKKSSLWETSPVGDLDQPFFLNSVIAIQTALPVDLLYEQIVRVECLLGKNKIRQNGPRSIDIDILYDGKGPSKTQSIIIPHERMWDRLFVLLPMREVILKEELSIKERLSDRIDELQHRTEDSAQIFIMME